jgi:hypothetical protein
VAVVAGVFTAVARDLAWIFKLAVAAPVVQVLSREV